MRLDSIREILAENVDRLNLTAAQIEAGNYRLSGIRKVIDAIKAIRLTGMFPKLCENLLSMQVISLSAVNEIVVPGETYRVFQPALSDLGSRVRHVLDALNEHVELAPPECIRVKFPETSDVAAAAKVMQELDTILNQAVANTYVDGKVTLHGFAEGSHWIDICVGSVAAFHFVAGLVRLYFSIKKYEVEQQARELVLADLGLQVEVRAAVSKAIIEQTEGYKRSQLTELLEKGGVPSTDKEHVLRVEHALDVLGQLLERGLEIHPALSAPMEERKLLPEPTDILDLIKKLPGSVTPAPSD